LASKVNPYIGKGIFPFMVLTEGTSPGGAPANKLNLKDWIGATNEPYTGSLDSEVPQAMLEDFFGVARDHFLLIDLATMKLVDMYDSDPIGAVDAAVQLLGP